MFDFCLFTIFFGCRYLRWLFLKIFCKSNCPAKFRLMHLMINQFGGLCDQCVWLKDNFLLWFKHLWWLEDGRCLDGLKYCHQSIRQNVRQIGAVPRKQSPFLSTLTWGQLKSIPANSGEMIDETGDDDWIMSTVGAIDYCTRTLCTTWRPSKESMSLTHTASHHKMSFWSPCFFSLDHMYQFFKFFRWSPPSVRQCSSDRSNCWSPLQHGHYTRARPTWAQFIVCDWVVLRRLFF